jgi:hypothetical protein
VATNGGMLAGCHLIVKTLSRKWGIITFGAVLVRAMPRWIDSSSEHEDEVRPG